jgi:hypothetical protein
MTNSQTASQIAQRVQDSAHDPERSIHARAEGSSVRIVNNNHGTDFTLMVIESCGRWFALDTQGITLDLGPVDA